MMLNKPQALNLFICRARSFSAMQDFTVSELWDFCEITMSWPSAEKGRLVGAEAGWSVPGVWLLSGDSCWLISFRFVRPAFWMAEQNVIMSLWGDGAVLDESFYPSSARVLLGISWWIDHIAQTSNNFSKWWCKKTAEPLESAGSHKRGNPLFKWSVAVTIEPWAWLKLVPPPMLFW